MFYNDQSYTRMVCMDKQEASLSDETPYQSWDEVVSDGDAAEVPSFLVISSKNALDKSTHCLKTDSNPCCYSPRHSAKPSFQWKKRVQHSPSHRSKDLVLALRCDMIPKDGPLPLNPLVLSFVNFLDLTRLQQGCSQIRWSLIKEGRILLCTDEEIADTFLVDLST